MDSGRDPFYPDSRWPVDNRIKRSVEGALNQVLGDDWYGAVPMVRTVIWRCGTYKSQIVVRCMLLYPISFSLDETKSNGSVLLVSEVDFRKAIRGESTAIGQRPNREMYHPERIFRCYERGDIHWFPSHGIVRVRCEGKE